MEAVHSSKRRRIHDIDTVDFPLDTDGIAHALALRRSLNAMRKGKQNCDVIIKIGKVELPAHKNVLMTQSDYINAMFTHDTLENQRGIVEMKDVRFKPVKKCVDFFYTGKISTSEEGCEDLLHTASLMQVKPVCDKISPFLQSRLTSKSFFDIKSIAVKFDLKNLNKACDDFAVEELDLIAKEDGFNQLDLNYISLLISSKKSSGLVNNDDPLLAIVLQWVKHDIEGRRQYFDKLMPLIDLKSITPAYGRYLVENEQLCYESNSYLKDLYLSVADHFTVTTKQSEIMFAKEPNSFLVFNLSSKYLEAYSPTSNSWAQLQLLHEAMLGDNQYVSVILDGFIYIVIENKRFYRSSVLGGSQWIRVNDMLAEHGNGLQAVTHDSFIYVTGNNTVERYSHARATWEAVHRDDIVCDDCALVSYEGSIYTIGGWDNHYECNVNDFNNFDPSSATWSKEDSMKVIRRTPAAVGHVEKIYVAGGLDGDAIQDVECFDLKTSTWSRLSSMIKARCMFGLCVVGNKLYAVGGYQDSCDIEMYDFQNEKWEVVVNNEDMEIMAQATVAAYLPSSSDTSSRASV